jgi:hypothetical protein
MGWGRHSNDASSQWRQPIKALNQLLFQALQIVE